MPVNDYKFHCFLNFIGFVVFVCFLKIYNLCNFFSNSKYIHFVPNFDLVHFVFFSLNRPSSCTVCIPGPQALDPLLWRNRNEETPSVFSLYPHLLCGTEHAFQALCS